MEHFEARVLIVDDMPANVEILSNMLASFNYDLSVANSGEKALQIVDKVRPHLILLDVMMPGINGFEVCNLLKSQDKTRDIPIIFITGMGDDAAQGFRVGGADYITKPVKQDELIARVHAQLKIAMLLNELAQKNASLTEARNELEQRVLERTRELSIANRNLRIEVNERRQAEERLQYLSKHDFLTRLINRNAFEDELSHLLLRVKQDDSEHALLYIDLDQFKIVNETCGHVAGDELLRQVADLLRSLIATSDVLSRLGGDEFGIILLDSDSARARRVADQIRQGLQDFRFDWQHHTFALAVSIGVTAINKSVNSVDEVFGRADTACFSAKESGRNRVQFYDENKPALQQRQAEMQWTSRLTEALELNRFVLFRQMIKSLRSEESGLHYEVLLRMRGTDDALIDPHSFIPAAERFGIMPQIDRWVVQRLFRQFALQPHLMDETALCTINLSGTTLNDPTFEAFLFQLFNEYGILASRICFEITETSAITNLPRTIRFIQRFKHLGCRFALDDFGSGVSSYAYLKALPVDFLKIDGAFVSAMLDDVVDRAMVRSINEIGQVMGKKTIAEFAETTDIVNALKDIGVDYAQGFACGKPAFFV